ncbi:alpha/beta-hydrolase [Karstenula rhodostoma CBS 690.94]|uniref:Alpha/beta-hydrolase n=1 Tax=Karstenula rhodostoma CBS 690.94 TaxID=1392251 RepID=A0A9P4UHI8_9PLEO|nr:alpha/beta-hydrolase [Karstenula rhodostoma CBS 690.94]
MGFASLSPTAGPEVMNGTHITDSTCIWSHRTPPISQKHHIQVTAHIYLIATTLHASSITILAPASPQTMPPSKPKPTILFVPGAWHLPSCYDLVSAPLSAAGFPTFSVSLPSNSHTPISSFEPDIAAIRSTLAPLVEGGKDVVIVAHSYGSVPANEALKGFTQRERAGRGEQGGVLHYVFISAFVTSVGVSLMDALQGEDLPWFIVQEDKMLVRPGNPREVFYGDLEAAEAETWVGRLVPFSYQCYFGKTTYAAYAHVESTFVFCTEDRAIPMQVQEGMVAAAEEQGAKFGRVVLEGSSHSPMISRSGEIIEEITILNGISSMENSAYIRIDLDDVESRKKVVLEFNTDDGISTVPRVNNCKYRTYIYHREFDPPPLGLYQELVCAAPYNEMICASLNDGMEICVSFPQQNGDFVMLLSDEIHFGLYRTVHLFHS